MIPDRTRQMRAFGSWIMKSGLNVAGQACLRTAAAEAVRICPKLALRLEPGRE